MSSITLILINHYCSLHRNQVPEWSSSYINYKGLKKLIKTAALAAKAGKDVDLTGRYRLPKYEAFIAKISISKSSSFPSIEISKMSTNFITRSSQMHHDD